MIGLIYNEVAKVVAQRRFIVVVSIMTFLAILIGLGAHANTVLHGLPITAAQEVSGLLVGSTILLFPFLFATVIGDIVAGEFTSGTMKLLLIRPVARWKIWLSKFVAANLVSALIVFYFGLCCYTALGAGIGFGSWSAPQGGIYDIQSSAGLVTLRVFSLELASVVSIVSFFLFLSTVVESGVAAVGLCAGLTVLMSVAIAIIQSIVKFVPKAHWLEYAFFEHWQIASYGNYSFPLNNWSIVGSLTTLGVWSLLFIAMGIAIFQMKDIKGA